MLLVWNFLQYHPEKGQPPPLRQIAKKKKHSLQIHPLFRDSSVDSPLAQLSSLSVWLSPLSSNQQVDQPTLDIFLMK